MYYYNKEKIMNSIFMMGDKVFYHGERHKQELAGKIGWIHCQVHNQKNVFVVEFPESKDHDSYILSGELLSKYRPPKEKQVGPDVEIAPRRRKRSDDEA